MYKVWDTADYRQLYELSSDSIAEVKVSPGLLLLVGRMHDGGHLVLRVLDIQSGVQLHKYNVQLHRGKPIEFVEQINEKLLVKQVDNPVVVYDVACPPVA